MFVSESLLSPNPSPADGSPRYSSKMETFHLFFWSCSLVSFAEISVRCFFFFPLRQQKWAVGSKHVILEIEDMDRNYRNATHSVVCGDPSEEWKASRGEKKGVIDTLTHSLEGILPGGKWNEWAEFNDSRQALLRTCVSKRPLLRQA